MSIVQEDAERLQRSQSKAPSVLMKSLVEKLKTDLAEKEKKQKVKMKFESWVKLLIEKNENGKGGESCRQKVKVKSSELES